MTCFDSELKELRQFLASKLVHIVGTRAVVRARFTRECDMKRILPGLIALLPLAAFADAPAEPPLEPHPMATIVFIVLFVGFCVVFAWMVWRKKEDKKEDHTPQS
jgi:hypothetical protein